MSKSNFATDGAPYLKQEIEPVSVARDLGVYIDQSLNYNEHISKLFSSCVHKLVQINRSNIYRIKHLLHRKTLLLMINAFVFSKLFYFSTVWGNTSKSNIKKLLLVQNFRKFEVALNPMYRIFLNFAKSCILSCLSKFYNNRTFTVPFSKYKRLKLKSRVFLAGHSVAMVTYCVTQIIATCSPVIGQFFDTMIVTSIDKEQS